MADFKTIMQQLIDMAAKGEIGNDEIKSIEYQLVSARRKGQSALRKASPDYAAKKDDVIAKAANTRVQNKKDIEADLKAYQAGLEAEEQEIQKRKSDNKLPLEISAYWGGIKKTKKSLDNLAKYYSDKFNPAGPGGQDYYSLILKPKFVDQTFDNAQTAWDVYDGKNSSPINEQFTRMQKLAGLITEYL